MKKSIKIFIYLILFAGILFSWFAYERHFYYFGNTEKCVTVWKKVGGECLIIPGKYYGIGFPDTYLEIKNLGNITLFWTNEMPEKFIVKNEGYYFKIISNKKSNTLFLKYEDKKEYYRNLLYLKNAQKHNEVKQNVEMLNVSIRESYVTDKEGKKL